MTRALSTFALFAGVLLEARAAHAYSDLARFGDPAAMGGGDGHWFTGAVGDGYTCAVCHEGQQGLPVTIQGLPERYQPNATYEVLLTWPASVEHVSALLEFNDERGQAAGSILLPGESEMAMTEADTCQPVGLGVPAAERLSAPDANVPGNRQLVGLADDCGGRQLHLQWTAPAQAIGPVFLNGGIVQSNDKDDLLGDTVLELSHPILPASQAEYTIDTKGGCAVADAGAHPWRGWLRQTLVFAFVIGLSRLRRRRQ